MPRYDYLLKIYYIINEIFAIEINTSRVRSKDCLSKDSMGGLAAG